MVGRNGALFGLNVSSLVRACVVLILALVGTGGCVQTTVDTYRKVPESRVDSAYAKPGVDFSRYQKLQPVPLEIYYYEGQAAPDPADLERLRQIFRTAFLAAIGDDYLLVDESGPDVLHVRASLVDLELSSVPADMPFQGRAAALVAEGHLTFFMELSDSLSGEVLARAADKEKDTGPVGVANTTQRDWERTTVAAEYWAGLFRDFLDKNLGH
ncbi:MAG: hypothetical protein DRR15_17510 [Gammaproteobacteria bacterium]|nr:MAG: hypothetical protein DRR15_17510 [Gammaproteobacteria bacterium]